MIVEGWLTSASSFADVHLSTEVVCLVPGIRLRSRHLCFPLLLEVPLALRSEPHTLLRAAGGARIVPFCVVHFVDLNLGLVCDFNSRETVNVLPTWIDGCRCGNLTVLHTRRNDLRTGDPEVGGVITPKRAKPTNEGESLEHASHAFHKRLQAPSPQRLIVMHGPHPSGSMCYTHSS